MTSTRASPFIGFTGTTSFQTSSEVIGMKEWTSCDEDLKKHGEIDPSLRTRKPLDMRAFEIVCGQTLNALPHISNRIESEEL